MSGRIRRRKSLGARFSLLTGLAPRWSRLLCPRRPAVRAAFASDSVQVGRYLCDVTAERYKSFPRGLVQERGYEFAEFCHFKEAGSHRESLQAVVAYRLREKAHKVQWESRLALGREIVQHVQRDALAREAGHFFGGLDSADGSLLQGARHYRLHGGARR